MHGKYIYLLTRIRLDTIEHVVIIVFYMQYTHHNHVNNITDPIQPPPTSIALTATPDTNISLPGSSSPLQYLYLEFFMAMGILPFIIQTTNNYAADHLTSVSPHCCSIFCTGKILVVWKWELSLEWSYKWDLSNSPTSKTNWSKHVTLNLRYFHSIFSWDRFLFGCCMWGKQLATTNATRYGHLWTFLCLSFSWAALPSI